MIAEERQARTSRPATEGLRPAPGIKFGTDGWRAVIADDFTFDKVRRVAGAIASYVLKHEDPSRGLVVGYDTRFGSPRFARVAAEVLARRIGRTIPLIYGGGPIGAVAAARWKCQVNENAKAPAFANKKLA